MSDTLKENKHGIIVQYFPHCTHGVKKTKEGYVIYIKNTIYQSDVKYIYSIYLKFNESSFIVNGLINTWTDDKVCKYKFEGRREVDKFQLFKMKEDALIPFISESLRDYIFVDSITMTKRMTEKFYARMYTVAKTVRTHLMKDVNEGRLIYNVRRKFFNTFGV